MTDREKLYDRWLISLMCGLWILSTMTDLVSDWLIPAGFARGLFGVAALSVLCAFAGFMSWAYTFYHPVWK